MVRTGLKKLMSAFVTLLLVAGTVSCGDAPKDKKETVPAKTGITKGIEEKDAASTGSSEDEDTPDPGPAKGDGVLVVYFSATGTTKGVAKTIAKYTGADLYEIKAAEEYTSDDLDYNNKDSRTSKEQNDKSFRPAIASDPVSLSEYGKVFIGYPIWWEQEPRIMDTFVENCDFSGITVIPFCTSGNSDIGQSGKDLEELSGSGNWLPGRRFGSGTADEDIKDWIDGLE